MALALIVAEVNVPIGPLSLTSQVNLDSADNDLNGHRPLASTTSPLKDNAISGHPETFKPDTCYRDRHRFSASAANLSKGPQHRNHQADFEISHCHHPAASVTSIGRTDDLQQTASNIAEGSTLETMQDSKANLGPHASIVVREWKLLWNAVTLVTPIHVDTGYLSVAKVTAVSKWVKTSTVSAFPEIIALHGSILTTCCV